MKDHDVIKNQIGQINDEMYDSDEEEESSDIKLEKEVVVSDHSSVIVNKYVEDTEAPTVANKFSDIIISLEKLLSAEKEDINPFPEDTIYVEDEIYVSDDDDESDELSEENFSFEDTMNLETMRKFRNDS